MVRTAGLRTPEWLLEQCERRLKENWRAIVLGSREWAPRFDLGTSGIKGATLREVWSAIHLDTLDWQAWASEAGAGVELVPRRVTYRRGVEQDIPGSVLVGSIDVAARLVGGEWPARIARARRRREVLVTSFATLDDPAAVLRLSDRYSDADFELACRVGHWLAAHPASGLTARQVPVEGIGSKWLDTHLPVVRRLAGLDDLGLVPGRPARVHLTYLDPGHRGAGGRRHDVATLGDVEALAYRPRVVLISENRDTAQLFPDLDGGIAVEGDGNGPGAVPRLPWVRTAETVWYWGDMDAKGLEILDSYRAAGVAARSLFMDLAAYERWERYGVDQDHDGTAIGARPAREVPMLEPAERELYVALCSPSWGRPRRIEQERIPLDAAAAAVRAG